MAGKLRETANISGGQAEAVALVRCETYTPEETIAQPPSFYRGKATSRDSTFRQTYSIARTTIGAKGAGIIGELKVIAPVDPARPVVQKFLGDDGVESKRGSLDEASWGAWRKVFDEVDKPSLTAGDVDGAGSAALQDIGTAGATVPTLDGNNAWSVPQNFTAVAISQAIQFNIGTLTLNPMGAASITAPILRISSNSGTSDDLVSLSRGAYGCPMVFILPTTGHTITVKNGTGNIWCGGADVIMDSPKDVMLLLNVRFGSGGDDEWLAVGGFTSNA